MKVEVAIGKAVEQLEAVANLDPNNRKEILLQIARDLTEARSTVEAGVILQIAEMNLYKIINEMWNDSHQLEAEVIRRLETLKNIIGKRAFTYLKRGGILRIWKRSTPHNWWIETKSGEQLWHSDDDIGRQLPDISLFNNVFKSKYTIPNGMAEELHYCLKDEHKNAL